MTLVLDLDETLIHTTTSLRQDAYNSGKKMACPDLLLELSVAQGYLPLYVFMRPYLHTFLREVSKWYEVVLFTASEQRYAESVTSRIDTMGVITRMFFRDSCTPIGPPERPFYVKDLTRVRPDLSKVILVDNSPVAYRQQPDNALPCTTWEGDPNDTELLSLLPILSALQASVSDVRSILGLRLASHRRESISRRHTTPLQYEQMHAYDQLNQ
jgi:Dullard-like phosphatase family protein